MSGCQVYVGNLSWGTSWQNLKDYMKKVGEVEYADVIREDNGRSKGWGVVKFLTPEDALRAIQELNDTELSGRRIIVREDSKPEKLQSSKRRRDSPIREEVDRYRRSGYSGERSGYSAQPRYEDRSPVRRSSYYRIVIDNLSYQTTWQTLKDRLREVCDPVRVDVDSDSNGLSKGTGVAEFASFDDAELAIRHLDRKSLDGRVVYAGWEQTERSEPQYEYYRERDDREYYYESRDRRVASTLEERPSKRQRASDDVIQIGRKVFVGNLPFSTTWQTLKDHFRHVGEVIRADVLQSGGVSKGCGVVEYASPMDAFDAIRKLHDTTIDGRRITVREDRQP